MASPADRTKRHKKLPGNNELWGVACQPGTESRPGIACPGWSGKLIPMPVSGVLMISKAAARIGWMRPAVCGACLMLAQQALAHGSVVDEDDECLIQIGFYRAHFTVFQPRMSGHREFCEDLPAAGETVFVMDYLHDSLRSAAVDFRIVRDRNGIGRFARYADVEALDLERETVFFRDAAIQRDGVLTVLHQFDAPGGYIGLVTVTDPRTEDVYRAVFPFAVGRFPWEFVYLVGAVAGLGVVGWWLRYRFLGAGSEAS